MTKVMSVLLSFLIKAMPYLLCNEQNLITCVKSFDTTNVALFYIKKNREWLELKSQLQCTQ